MAPSASAVSRLSGAVSTATIRVAPAMRAPWTTDWPTPPQPSTATDDPGHTAAVLSTAPTPVVTPQPMSASCSSGRSVSHLHERALVDQRVVGEGPDAQHGHGGAAVAAREPALAALVGQLLAQPRLAAPAEPARAARRHPRADDAVARRHDVDLGADLLDDAGALVAEDDRRLDRRVALPEEQVRVAQPAGADAHQRLTRAERGRRDLLDAQRRVELGHDGGAHRATYIVRPCPTSPSSPSAATACC